MRTLGVSVHCAASVNGARQKLESGSYNRSADGLALTLSESSRKQEQRKHSGAKGELVKKIFVGNFSFSTTEADLRQWFEPHGAVDSATVVTDRDTGRPRGFGFIEMPSNSEADAAILALNGSDAGGRPLTVNEARPKTNGRIRGGHGGGRDDYRGHARQPREPRW